MTSRRSAGTLASIQNWLRQHSDFLNTTIHQVLSGSDDVARPLTKEKIVQIPKMTVTEEHVVENQQCSVCTEDFQLNDEVLQLPCSVSFWILFVWAWGMCQTQMDRGFQNNIVAMENALVWRFWGNLGREETFIWSEEGPLTVYFRVLRQSFPFCKRDAEKMFLFTTCNDVRGRYWKNQRLGWLIVADT